MIWRREIDEENKRNLTAAVLVFAATLSTTPVFAAKEKRRVLLKQTQRAFRKRYQRKTMASAQSLIMQAMRLHFQRK